MSKKQPFLLQFNTRSQLYVISFVALAVGFFGLFSETISDFTRACLLFGLTVKMILYFLNSMVLTEEGTKK